MSFFPEMDAVKVTPNNERRGCFANICRNLNCKLYTNRALSAWGDRCWNFAVGLYLIKLYPTSLLLASIHGIVASSAVFVFSPLIGRWVDKSPRLYEAKVALFLQNSSVCLSASFAALFFARDLLPVNERIYDVISIVSPLGLLFFSVTAQLWSSAYTLILEKDWVLALVSDEDQLTKLNSTLRRIDLTINLLAPVLVGLLMQYSDLASALFLAFWNLFSSFIEYYLLRSIFNSGPETIREAKEAKTTKLKILDFEAIAEYKEHFLLPGLSFALLYLTVLGFDSITIGWLSSNGVSESNIGYISLLAGLFGVFGTFLFPLLMKILGLKRTGLIGFTSQSLSLILCLFVAFSYFDAPLFSGISIGTFLFLAGLVVSRTGLWIADLSINQLIQTETPRPSIAGGVQNSFNVVTELAKFILLAFLPAIDQFWILVFVSYTSVLLGTLMFLVYYLRSLRPTLMRIEKTPQYGTFQ